jgi:hypothetical protein
MLRLTVFRMFIIGAMAAAFSGCGGGGTSSSSVVPGGANAPNGATLQAEGSRRIAISPTAPPTCTPIVSVNPATQLNHARTARFIAASNDGDEFSGEDEHGERARNVDGAPCDYGIYAGPNVKHLHIHNARIHGASRIQIVADGAQDVTVRESAIDAGGGSVCPANPCDGMWFAYGASGSVEHSFVTNAFTGIVIDFGSRALVGETRITNASFLGVNIYQADGTVEDTLIDNSMNVGSGVAVQFPGTGTIHRTTAVGAGKPTAFGPQFGFFFGHGHPTVKIDHSTAKHNQTGFGSYCAIGINNVDDLTDAHNRAQNSTVTNYDVNNNPGVNC